MSGKLCAERQLFTIPSAGRTSLLSEEALRMGLANRLTPRGQALAGAVTLANELAALPQRCLRSDRLSALEQWSLGWREAMLNESHRGMTVINSGESKEGATRFAAGAGRHGTKA